MSTRRMCRGAAETPPLQRSWGGAVTGGQVQRPPQSPAHNAARRRPPVPLLKVGRPEEQVRIQRRLVDHVSAPSDIDDNMAVGELERAAADAAAEGKAAAGTTESQWPEKRFASELQRGGDLPQVRADVSGDDDNNNGVEPMMVAPAIGLV